MARHAAGNGRLTANQKRGPQTGQEVSSPQARQEMAACGGRDSVPMAPCPIRRLIVASTSIDLIHLSEDVEGDRYSNFNPCYKSTTPPDDISIPYPMIPQTASSFSQTPQTSLPTLHEHVEQVSCAMSLQKQTKVSRSAGQLQELSINDLLGCLPQASWMAAANHGSSSSSPSPSPSPVPPPPPPPAITRMSPSFKDYSKYLPRSAESSRSGSELLPLPVAQASRPTDEVVCMTTVKSEVKMRNKSSCVPMVSSLRSSWVYVPDPNHEASQSDDDPDNPDTHFYWELEFPGQPESPSEAVAAIPVGPVNNPVVKPNKPLVKPATKPKPMFYSPVSRSHSSSPVNKTVKCPGGEQETPLPQPAARAKTYRQNCGSPNGMACPTGSPRSISDKGQHIREHCQSPRNGDPSTQPDARSQSDTSDDNTKYDVVRKDKSSGLFFRRRSPSRRSQSCEQLSVSSQLKKDGKRSRRRCPTPPRVLSPNIDDMKYELIVDI